MVRIKKKIKIPRAINKLHSLFKQNGAELYLVGGCVRDILMKLEPKDYDLTTNVNPEETINILASGGIKYVDEDSRFGTIRAIIDSVDYEIVTFRSDGDYLDNRRPDSVTFGSIEMDALRRDFTINSLYYDLNTKEIIDFNGGVKDIKNKKLRFVGDANDRLTEDSLRALRAIRFATRFGFEFDYSVLMPFIELKGVTNERIRKEFISMLKSNVNDVIKVLIKTTFIKKVLDLPISINLTSLPNLKMTEPVSILATLLHYNGSKIDIKKHFNGLKYSKEECKKIEFIFNFINSDPNDLYTLYKQYKSIYGLNGADFIMDLTPVSSTMDRLDLSNLVWVLITYEEIKAVDLSDFGFELTSVELGEKLREVNNRKLSRLLKERLNKNEAK